MNYIGPSMNPTLKSGDQLQVIPYDGHRIRRGDVVVFTPPGSDSKIIHRIVLMGSQGIRTRGDNCNQVDQWVLKPDHIFGRVAYARRGNMRRRIIGGLLGHLVGAAIRAIHAVDSRVSFVVRPAYDQLIRAGIFRQWLPDQIKPRVFSFDRPTGTELQLLMGRHVIGRWLPGRTRWYIRRPFRLFVDEAALPENSAKGSVVRGPLARHSRSSDGALSVVKKKISQDMVVND